MTQKIIKIGNSLGTILPAEVVKQFGLKTGDYVNLEINPVDEKTNATNEEVLKALASVNERYGSALRKLASL